MFGPAPFDPEKDIPSLEGKVILITGANVGLGREQLRYLAPHHPSKLYLGARSQEKAEATIAEIEKAIPGSKIDFLQLDLTSLASVKKAADQFKRENERLDVLVNNAGIMAHPPGLTQDGYEVQFGTNHMGHFLLTRELMPLLQSTAKPGADVRIVNLSSVGHKFAPTGGFLPEAAKTDMASYTSWTRYGQSKLANVLFTNELARRYPNITSVTVHPGGVNTNLATEVKNNNAWINFFYGPIQSLVTSTPAQGALTQTWASVAPLAKGEPDAHWARKPRVVQGEYYQPVAATGGRSKDARNSELAKKLWEWSEAEVVSKGY